MTAPTTSAEFDSAYSAPITPWGDLRVPAEVKALARSRPTGSVLELGCGVGRFSRYMARQGWSAVGVDFSPIAIVKAEKSVANDDVKPRFIVGDVTRLEALSGPFDVSFDVGCFHCLDAAGQQAYASEASRLLRHGATHLIWALDWSPGDMGLSPAAIEMVFASGFYLEKAQASRRRFAASHWYWLVRR